MVDSVGEERATEAVSGAARVLGLGTTHLSPLQVQAIYEFLAKASGLVGITARATLRKGDPPSMDAPGSSERLATLPDDVRTATGTRLAYAEIYALFSPCVGDEKAGELVRAAIVELCLSPRTLGKEEVLELLEHLASEPGIVGVTARFAKARIILRFT